MQIKLEIAQVNGVYTLQFREIDVDFPQVIIELSSYVSYNLAVERYNLVIGYIVKGLVGYPWSPSKCYWNLCLSGEIPNKFCIFEPKENFLELLKIGKKE